MRVKSVVFSDKQTKTNDSFDMLALVRACQYSGYVSARHADGQTQRVGGVNQKGGTAVAEPQPSCGLAAA